MYQYIRTFSVLALTLGIFSSTAVSQDETVLPTYTSVYEVSPRPGHTIKFEEAFKQHMEWTRQQNSNWGWDVFEILAGKRVGNYLLVSRNHTWEDFDANQEFATSAMARWRAKVSEHVESIEGGFYKMMPDFSRIPDNVDSYPFLR